MKALLVPLAIASTISTVAAWGQDYCKQIFSVALRGGKTQVIRRITSTSTHCAPLFQGIEAIDIFEGPPEVSLTSEPGKVRTSKAGHDCPDPVPGAVVSITAKNVTEYKEGILTFRVRMNTKGGSASQTARYRLLLYPARAGDPSTAA